MKRKQSAFVFKREDCLWFHWTVAFRNYASDICYVWQKTQWALLRNIRGASHLNPSFQKLGFIVHQPGRSLDQLMQTGSERSHFLVLTCQEGLGKTWITGTLLWSKGWWEEVGERLAAPQSAGKLSGCLCKRDDLHVQRLTATGETVKEAKSSWRIKWDSPSQKVNLAYEFPQCWETLAGFTPPL